MLVFIILLLIWFILNGRFTLEVALWGLGVSSFVYFFLCKFTHFSFQKDKKFCRNFFLLIAYFGVLLKEIFISNINVIKVIFGPKEKTAPEIVKIHIDIKSEFLRTLVANSITLTPGTISIDVEGNLFTVYSLKREMIDGFENSTLVKLAKRMEG